MSLEPAGADWVPVHQWTVEGVEGGTMGVRASVQGDLLPRQYLTAFIYDNLPAGDR